MEERHRAEGARSTHADPNTQPTQQRPTQQRPTQDELRAHSQEFGGEANTISDLSAQVAALVRLLGQAVAQINSIAANGNGHGQSRQFQPAPDSESGWAYNGIDTARDHKILGEALGLFRQGVLELTSLVMEVPPAIVRLESRFENRFIQLRQDNAQLRQDNIQIRQDIARLEYALSQLKRAA